MHFIHYLKNGTGKACAGHNSVRLSPCAPLNDFELSVVANFGNTLAIGSNDKKSIRFQLVHHELTSSGSSKRDRRARVPKNIDKSLY